MATQSHTDGGVGPEDLELGMNVQLGPWKTEIVWLGDIGCKVRGDIGNITENTVSVTKEYASNHLITGRR
jgi:hypothetical protein